MTTSIKEFHLLYEKRIRNSEPPSNPHRADSVVSDTVINQNTPGAFLQKPFTPPTLLKCVQRVLDSEFKGICDESDLLKDRAA
jgi:hypothetical protein